jgi:hypothetical protein
MKIAGQPVGYRLTNFLIFFVKVVLFPQAIPSAKEPGGSRMQLRALYSVRPDSSPHFPTAQPINAAKDI